LAYKKNNGSKLTTKGVLDVGSTPTFSTKSPLARKS